MQTFESDFNSDNFLIVKRNLRNSLRNGDYSRRKVEVAPRYYVAILLHVEQTFIDKKCRKTTFFGARTCLKRR